MGYLALIIIFLVILNYVEKHTYHWETIIKHLWKQIYAHADLMASRIHQFKIKPSDKDFDLSISGFKSQIEFRGKLINSILDYINNIRKEQDEDAEEETFGYGHYNFDTILMMAQKDPDVFEKLKK